MFYLKERFILERIIRKLKIPKYLRPGLCIGGGALTSIFSNAPINDIDIFCESDEYFEKMKVYFKDYSFTSYTENAITYYVDGLTGKTLQLVQKYTGTPQQLINQFDFTICSCAYHLGTKKFIHHDLFLHHIRHKKLSLNINADGRYYSYKRLKKYIDRGYELDNIGVLCNKCLDRYACLTDGEKKCLKVRGYR